MNIALRHLTDGESGFTNNYNTASISPLSGRLLIMTIANHMISADGPNAPLPVPSGLGITWELIGTRQNSSDNKQRISMYKARSNGNSGQVNINAVYTTRSIFWSIDEFTPVIRSLTKAVPQYGTQSHGTSDPMNMTVSLGAFQSDKNATLFACISPDMPTVPSGFSSVVAHSQDNGPDNNFRVAFNENPSTSINTTSTGSGAEVATAIACEIRAAEYGGGGLLALL